MKVITTMSPLQTYSSCLILFMDSVCKQYQDELILGETTQDEFVDNIRLFLNKKINVLEHTVWNKLLVNVYAITKGAVQNHKDRKDKEVKDGKDISTLVHHSDIIKTVLTLFNQSMLNKEFYKFKGKFEGLDVPNDVYLEILLINADIAEQCKVKPVTDSLNAKPKIKTPKIKTPKIKTPKIKKPKSKTLKLSVVKAILRKKAVNFISRNENKVTVGYNGYECEITAENNLGILVDEFVCQVDNSSRTEPYIKDLVTSLGVTLVSYSTKELVVEYSGYEAVLDNNMLIKDVLNDFVEQVKEVA